MANIFNLGEVSYESLFTKTGINQNDRDHLVQRQFDIDKFANGIAAVKDQFKTLGMPKGKTALRTSPHYLSRNFLENKGLDCSKLGPPYQHWFCSFDLYNRSNPQDPNGPRRIICVCENDSQDGFYASANGGRIIHVLYTNNHYGDGGKKPAFQYVKRPAQTTPSTTLK